MREEKDRKNHMYAQVVCPSGLCSCATLGLPPDHSPAEQQGEQEHKTEIATKTESQNAWRVLPRQCEVKKKWFCVWKKSRYGSIDDPKRRDLAGNHPRLQDASTKEIIVVRFGKW